MAGLSGPPFFYKYDVRHFIDLTQSLFESFYPEGDIQGKMKLGPINYDQREGIGAVPDNANINYKGFACLMTPTAFLELALRRGYDSPYVDDAIKNGEPIGSPFFGIAFDETTEQLGNGEAEGKGPPHILNHEGRGRMIAIRKLYGDIPVIVHCFPSYLRARHMTLEMIKSFQTEAFMEKSKVTTRKRNCLSEVWLQGWKSLDSI